MGNNHSVSCQDKKSSSTVCSCDDSSSFQHETHQEFVPEGNTRSETVVEMPPRNIYLSNVIEIEICYLDNVRQQNVSNWRLIAAMTKRDHEMPLRNAIGSFCAIITQSRQFLYLKQTNFNLLLDSGTLVTFMDRLKAKFCVHTC